MLYSRGFPQGLPHPSFAHPRRELRRPPQQRRLSDGPSRKWSRHIFPKHSVRLPGRGAKECAKRRASRPAAAAARGDRWPTSAQKHILPKVAETGSVPCRTQRRSQTIGIGAHLLAAQQRNNRVATKLSIGERACGRNTGRTQGPAPRAPLAATICAKQSPRCRAARVSVCGPLMN